MILFPAIDLLGGKCVRLRQGAYDQVTEYGDDPVAVAKTFADQGAEWIHMVDLEGARSGEPAHLEVLSRVANELSIPIQYGGGLRSAGSVGRALDAGATRAIVGTKLTGDPRVATQLFAEFGERLVAGIDARNGEVAIHGWTAGSGRPVIQFVREMVSVGCRRVIYTDIGRDGELAGPDIDGTARLVQESKVAVVASGGVASLNDLVSLKGAGVEGVIIGKALYESRFTLVEALNWVQPDRS
ncbi:MAG: 1-(5-phosphoribosyl)-5-[(5-phosphoribosylamino)methylideneamino]imidazole-4-carboxamide isomerase [Fimbriimonadaceae bacterium]|nr:1-(5-phosphoribosyl)-5-[(5-phosphoribosylamino)methylideneamino]imidazole-4-carboxamide isomerase [Fimbriimonadaceae bacterium]